MQSLNFANSQELCNHVLGGENRTMRANKIDFTNTPIVSLGMQIGDMGGSSPIQALNLRNEAVSPQNGGTSPVRPSISNILPTLGMS